jgi:hypothetical protein
MINQLVLPLYPPLPGVDLSSSSQSTENELKLACLRGLTTVVRVCKPRIIFWKGTIIDAVARCWVHEAEKHGWFMPSLLLFGCMILPMQGLIRSRQVQERFVRNWGDRVPPPSMCVSIPYLCCFRWQLTGLVILPRTNSDGLWKQISCSSTC